MGILGSFQLRRHDPQAALWGQRCEHTGLAKGQILRNVSSSWQTYLHQENTWRPLQVLTTPRSIKTPQDLGYPLLSP